MTDAQLDRLLKCIDTNTNKMVEATDDQRNAIHSVLMDIGAVLVSLRDLAAAVGAEHDNHAR